MFSLSIEVLSSFSCGASILLGYNLEYLQTKSTNQTELLNLWRCSGLGKVSMYTAIKTSLFSLNWLKSMEAPVDVTSKGLPFLQWINPPHTPRFDECDTASSGSVFQILHTAKYNGNRVCIRSVRQGFINPTCAFLRPQVAASFGISLNILQVLEVWNVVIEKKQAMLSNFVTLEVWETI